MNYTNNDLDFFVQNIWDSTFSNNNGGMGAPDMFSLFFALKQIKPKIIIESGVWNGFSTKLIRKTCPNSVIISLDPRNIPSSGYKDSCTNTIYHLGNKFIDFSNLDLTQYNSDDIFCFFDCHQNAYTRLIQCYEKNIKHIFFNDNYPVNCGSHFTIEHLINDDNRHCSINNCEKTKILNIIDIYHIYPNIYPGTIKTLEGVFDCKNYFNNFDNLDKYGIFKTEREKYRWNTYIKLK